MNLMIYNWLIMGVLRMTGDLSCGNFSLSHPLCTSISLPVVFVCISVFSHMITSFIWISARIFIWSHCWLFDDKFIKGWFLLWWQRVKEIVHSAVHAVFHIWQTVKVWGAIYLKTLCGWSVVCLPVSYFSSLPSICQSSPVCYMASLALLSILVSICKHITKCWNWMGGICSVVSL